jgi:hypothetical protein
MTNLDPKTLRWCAEICEGQAQLYSGSYEPGWLADQLGEWFTDEAEKVEKAQAEQDPQWSNEKPIEHAKKLLEAEGYRVTLDDGQHVLSEDQARQLEEWAEEFDIGCVDLGELANKISGWMDDARVSKGDDKKVFRKAVHQEFVEAAKAEEDYQEAEMWRQGARTNGETVRAWAVYPEGADPIMCGDMFRTETRATEQALEWTESEGKKYLAVPLEIRVAK